MELIFNPPLVGEGHTSSLPEFFLIVGAAYGVKKRVLAALLLGSVVFLTFDSTSC